MRRIDQIRARRTRPQASPQRSAQALKTLAFILIVFLILAITTTRSWHYIHWSTH